MLKNLPTGAKVFFGLAAILFIYGIFCRVLNIYFFWESLYLSLAMVLPGVGFLLYARIRRKKQNGQDYLQELIGMVAVPVLLIIPVVFYVFVPQSGAYIAATSYLKNEAEIRHEIGTVEGFILVPVGAQQTQISGSEYHANASLRFVVKGSIEYKTVTVYLSKNSAGGPWQVDGLE